ncbi:hypothetical protein PV10_06439 [Exophiala mesophila]|uniref:Uncharacterized protein n=1 Tax=Exophiala mesophila TaxID=212818 RepID=A0A0D1ZYL8_EXOME|nr:uncharacterized protein PV10_06439 [Exophiala mesophila]KIV91953.1 hypothetical protein PV10_06439 [Exophiala mesophila]
MMTNIPKPPTSPHSPDGPNELPGTGIDEPALLQDTTSPTNFQLFEGNEKQELNHHANAEEVEDGSDALQETPMAKSLLSKTFSTSVTEPSLLQNTMHISRPTNHDSGIGFLEFAFLPRQAPKPTSYAHQRTHTDRPSIVDDKQPEGNNANAGYIPAHVPAEHVQPVTTEEHTLTLGEPNLQDTSHHPRVLGASFCPSNLSRPTPAISEHCSSDKEYTVDETIQQPALERPGGLPPMTADAFSTVSADAEPRSSPMADKPTIFKDISRRASEAADAPQIYTPRTVSGTSRGRAVCDSRVSKRSRQQRFPKTQPSHTNTGAFACAPPPSEEDLLYLLMARARENHQKNTTFLELQESYAVLHAENKELQTELHQASQAYIASDEKQKTISEHLECFKQKYYKLKKWAIEANADCLALQTQSNHLNRSIAEISQDKDTLKTDIKQLQHSQEHASCQMTGLRSSIVDIKTLAQESLEQSWKNEGLIMAKTEQLRREQARSEKLEGYISQMERHKRSYDNRYQQDNQRVSGHLKMISEAVTMLKDSCHSSKTEHVKLMNSLARCEASLTQELASKSDLSHLQDQLVDLIKSVEDSPLILSAALHSRFDSLEQSLDATSSRLTSAQQCHAADVDNHLKQQASEATTSIDILKQVLTQTIGNKRSIKRLATDRTQEQLKNLTEQLETCQQELQKVNSDAIAFESRKEIDCARIKSLEMQLNVAMTAEKGARQEVEKAQNELHAMKVSRTDALTKCDELQEALKQGVDKNEQSAAQLQLLKSQKDIWETKARTFESDLTSSRQVCEATKTRLVESEARVHTAEAQLNSLSKIQHDLDAANSTISAIRLEERSSKEHAARQEKLAKTLTLEVQDLNSQVTALQKQLSEAEALHSVIEDLKVDSQAKQDLQLEVGLKEAEICQLEQMLCESRETLEKVAELEHNNSRLRAAESALIDELKVARELGRQSEELTEAINARDVTIEKLKREVAEWPTMQMQLSQLKEEADRKNHQIALLQSQIRSQEYQAASVGATEIVPTAHPTIPLKRAADRSSYSFGPKHIQRVNAFLHEDEDPIQATGLINDTFPDQSQADLREPQSTFSIITETQLESQEIFKEMPPESYPKQKTAPSLELTANGGVSPLTEIDDELLDAILNMTTPLTEATPVAPDTHPTNPTSAPVDSQGLKQRPASSSYGSIDQMLLDHGTQSDTTSKSRLNQSNSYYLPDSAIGDARSREKVKKTSPRRLRSSHLARKDKMAGSEEGFDFEVDRVSTPSRPRERHQPNSAVKRQGDHQEATVTPDQPTKRVKRTSANGKGNGASNVQVDVKTSKKSPKRTILTFRRSSIVGTNAPAPDRNPKGARAAKKGSRQDKYSARFSAAT